MLRFRNRLASRRRSPRVRPFRLRLSELEARVVPANSLDGIAPVTRPRLRRLHQRRRDRRHPGARAGCGSIRLRRSSRSPASSPRASSPKPTCRPAHDSHDQNTHILVDADSSTSLSRRGIRQPAVHRRMIPAKSRSSGKPASARMSTRVTAPTPIFPKWVWPSVGDRVWVEGNWIYDAGHPTKVDGISGSAPRSTRRAPSPPCGTEFAPMPGTGGVPVHITGTDLYIHGDGGYATEVLNGGQALILPAAQHPDHPDRRQLRLRHPAPGQAVRHGRLRLFGHRGPGNTVGDRPGPDP